ncbi:MAG: preprotein translocase subunit SecA, partial [Candidatus Kapaibacterium sp.]
MFGLLKKVFGTKHDRDVKEMLPVVEEINSIYATLSGLSDEDLRAKSDALRARIAEAKKDHETVREELRAELQKDTVTHDERLDIYKSIEDSEKAEYGMVAELLDEMLPEAFALVKETARRLTER